MNFECSVLKHSQRDLIYLHMNHDPALCVCRRRPTPSPSEEGNWRDAPVTNVPLLGGVRGVGSAGGGNNVEPIPNSVRLQWGVSEHI